MNRLEIFGSFGETPLNNFVASDVAKHLTMWNMYLHQVGVVGGVGVGIVGIVGKWFAKSHFFLSPSPSLLSPPAPL